MINLIAFCEDTTGLTDERKAVDLFHLDCSKAFDTVFCNILINEQMKYRLKMCTARWSENWLNSQAKSVAITYTKVQMEASHQQCGPEVNAGSSTVQHLHS